MTPARQWTPPEGVTVLREDGTTEMAYEALAEGQRVVIQTRVVPRGHVGGAPIFCPACRKRNGLLQRSAGKDSRICHRCRREFEVTVTACAEASASTAPS